MSGGSMAQPIELTVAGGHAIRPAVAPLMHRYGHTYIHALLPQRVVIVRIIQPEGVYMV
jgi:hypothetical protein